jgi:hypothetical protein
MNMHMHEMYAQPVSLHIYDVLSDSSKNLDCYRYPPHVGNKEMTYLKPFRHPKQVVPTTH